MPKVEVPQLPNARGRDDDQRIEGATAADVQVFSSAHI